MTQRVEVQYVGSAGSLIAATKAAQEAMSGMQTGVKSLTHLLEGVGVGFGIGELFGLGKESVKKFAEMEQAQRGLAVTLSATGRGGKAAFEQITEGALQVEKETGKLDDDVIAATTRLAQYARKLSAGDLANAQRAIVALSEKTGSDLESSAKLIGRALSSHRDVLARQGIQLDKNASQTEKLAQLNSQLAASYETAKSRTEGSAGALEHMHNGWIKVTEAIGGVILKVFGFDKGMSQLGDALYNLAEWLKSNAGEWAAWGKLAVAWIKNVGAQSIDAVKFLAGATGLLGKHPIQAAKDMAAAWKDAEASQKTFDTAQAEYDNRKPGTFEWLTFDWTKKYGTGGPEIEPDIKEKAKKAGATWAEYFKETVNWYWDSHNERGAKGLFGKLTGKQNGGALPAQGGGFAEITQLQTQIKDQMASDAFKQELAAKGAQVGESFIRGIIHGTFNLRDTLASALEELAITSIMGPLKTALGIHSPSKAGIWIGQMFSQGIMQGMGGSPLAGLAGLGAGASVEVHHHTSNIYAMDAGSFTQFAMRNAAAFGAATAMAAYKNPQLAAVLAGGGR